MKYIFLKQKNNLKFIISVSFSILIFFAILKVFLSQDWLTNSKHHSQKRWEKSSSNRGKHVEFHNKFKKMFSPKSKVDKLRQVESPSLRRRSLQLPTPLRCEVRSPGFSSRLSTLIRENEAGTQQKNAKKALQPPLAAAAFNPKYQGFGSMPRVKLERRSLPRLAMKNSPSSVKSPMGMGVTTVKVAPAEPFSPFRSNNTSMNR